MRLLTLGILAGLILSVPIRRALIHYSEYSLPKPDHQGTKVITWHRGEREAWIA